MNKRHVHHYAKHVKWYYLLPAAAITGTVSVLALRGNSQKMSTLRQAVYDADRDNGDTQTALSALQQHVTAHMNTSLTNGNTDVYPPIQLQYTYQRLVQQQGSTLQSKNSGLYTEAEAFCEKQNPTGFSGRYRLDCITKYVNEHGSQTTTSTAVSPSLYQFNFVSPSWSPDLAGITLVMTIILLAAALSSFVLQRVLKHHQ